MGLRDIVPVAHHQHHHHHISQDGNFVCMYVGTSAALQKATRHISCSPFGLDRISHLKRARDVALLGLGLFGLLSKRFDRIRRLSRALSDISCPILIR